LQQTLSPKNAFSFLILLVIAGVMLQNHQHMQSMPKKPAHFAL